MEGSPLPRKNARPRLRAAPRPRQRGHVGAVIQAYLHTQRARLPGALRRRHPHPALQRGVQRGARDRLPGQGRRRRKLRQADEDPAQERRLSRHRHSRPKDDRGHDRLRASREHRPETSSSSRCFTACAATCRNKLVREGWHARLHPIGTSGIRTMRRLAERPANAIFILRESRSAVNSASLTSHCGRSLQRS